MLARYLPLSVLFVFFLTIPVFAQSSTRGLPSVVPSENCVIRAQPYVVPQTQGSSTRGGTIIGQPMTGSSTRGGVVQGGTVVERGSAVAGQRMAATKVLTFEQKLWGYLIRGKYRNWAPVPGESDEMYEGQSPHGAFLKMYLNRKAAGSPKHLPSGSIVIKENYTPAKTLAAITVMYKTKGYNPQAGDWYWVKYNPDGSVATKATADGAKRLAGKVGGCIDCHSGADGGDFAFFND